MKASTKVMLKEAISITGSGCMVNLVGDVIDPIITKSQAPVVVKVVSLIAVGVGKVFMAMYSYSWVREKLDQKMGTDEEIYKKEING